MNTNTKHTPGPWRVAAYLDGSMTEVMAGEMYIAPAVWQPRIADDGTQVEREANARLIAAAPELLEALERLVRVASVELGDKRPDVFEQCRAAIAKAC